MAVTKKAAAKWPQQNVRGKKSCSQFLKKFLEIFNIAQNENRAILKILYETFYYRLK